MLKDESQPSWSKNCSVSARNLRKSDLGAVIFGCKNNTMDECYNRLLFGLPAPHFAYVKNVTPGLPLFLFNYSDRNLHGIFEAVSPGQMNINPYGWMGDGSNTPYPAQVRVRIQMQCKTLSEVQFKPIIAENYYENRLFWFELDRTQTQRLISLFSSSPVAGNTSLSQNTLRCRTTTVTSQAGDDITASVSEAYIGHSDRSNMQWDSWDAPGLGTESHNWEAPVGVDNAEHSYSSAFGNMSASLPQKKWSSLFKTSTVPQSSCAAPNPEVEDHLLEAQVDEWAVEKPDCEYLYSSAMIEATGGSVQLGASFEKPDCEKPDCQYLYTSALIEPTGGSVQLGAPLPSADTRQGEENPKRVESEAVTVLEERSSDTQSVLDKLLQQVEALKASNLRQIIKINSLEQELVNSKIEIQQLKGRCSILEAGQSIQMGVMIKEHFGRT